jgi:hypothetical protein
LGKLGKLREAALPWLPPTTQKMMVAEKLSPAKKLSSFRLELNFAVKLVNKLKRTGPYSFFTCSGNY